MTDIDDNVTDEFAAMPSITPERDDHVDRNPRRSSPAEKTTVKHTGASKTLQKTSEQMRTLITLALLAFALVMVFGGLVYLYDQLEKTQQNLLAATVRVEQLEARLVSTDTTMTKSDVLLSAKIKSMDGQIDSSKIEIRKLWASAEKNTKAIQAQASDLQQQKPLLQSVIEQSKQTADQVAVDSPLLKSLDSTVKEAVQRIEIAQENLNDTNDAVKAVKEKQTTTDANVGKRVSALEDSAKSTDVFRRNTQDELRKLREEVMKQTPGTGSRLPP